MQTSHWHIRFIFVVLVVALFTHAADARFLNFDPSIWTLGKVPPRPAALDDNATAVHCYRHVLEGSDLQALNDARDDHHYVYHFPLHGLDEERAYRRRLFHADIELVEWGAVTEDRCRGTIGNRSYALPADAALYSWAGQATWMAFARLPVPCGIERTQRYGLAANSPLYWGSTPHVRDDSRIYAPTHGAVPMDAPWNDEASVAEAGSSAQYLTLSMRYQSTSLYPLQRLVVRKCIALLEPLSESDALALDAPSAIDETAMWRTRSDVALLTARIYVPRVLLFRSVVQRESDATCSVWLGYSYTPDANDTGASELDVSPRHTVNRLSASAPAGAKPAHRLQSGVHRNEQHVRWMCEQKISHAYVPLAWSLADQHLVLPPPSSQLQANFLYTEAYRHFEQTQSDNSRLELLLGKPGHHAPQAQAPRPLRPDAVDAERNYTPAQTKSLLESAMLAIFLLAAIWLALSWYTGQPQIAGYVVLVIVLVVFGVLSLNILTTNNDFQAPGQTPLEEQVSNAEQLYGTQLPNNAYGDAPM